MNDWKVGFLVLALLFISHVTLDKRYWEAQYLICKMGTVIPTLMTDFIGS